MPDTAPPPVKNLTNQRPIATPSPPLPGEIPIPASPTPSSVYVDSVQTLPVSSAPAVTKRDRAIHFENGVDTDVAPPFNPMGFSADA